MRGCLPCNSTWLTLSLVLAPQLINSIQMLYCPHEGVLPPQAMETDLRYTKCLTSQTCRLTRNRAISVKWAIVPIHQLSADDINNCYNRDSRKITKIIKSLKRTACTSMPARRRIDRRWQAQRSAETTITLPFARRSITTRTWSRIQSTRFIGNLSATIISMLMRVKTIQLRFQWTGKRIQFIRVSVSVADCPKKLYCN